MPTIRLAAWVVRGCRVVIARETGGPLTFQIGDILVIEDQGSEELNRQLAECVAVEPHLLQGRSRTGVA